LAAATATAVEKISAIGFKATDTGALWHEQLLKHGTAIGVDPSYVAFISLPCAVPERVVDPGNACDKTVGHDVADDGAGFRVDLHNRAIAILTHPQAAFGPGQT